MYAKYQRNATSNFNTLGILWHCLVNFRSYLNSFLGKLSTVCAGSANVLPVSSLIILPGPVVTKFTNPSTLILNRNVHKGAKTHNWGWVLAFGKFVTTGPVLNLCYWYCGVWHLMRQTYSCCCCLRQYYRWRMTPAKLYAFAGPYFLLVMYLQRNLWGCCIVTYRHSVNKQKIQH